MAKRDVQRQARGKGSAAALLVSLYVAAELRISNVIQRLTGRESAQEYRRMRAEIAAALQGLNLRGPDLGREAIVRAFETGGHEAGRLLKREPLSALNTSAADVLISNLVDGLNGATETVGRRVDDVFRRVALQGALRQVEANEPERFSIDTMLRQLERDGITGFVDRAGKRWKLSTYAEMAVRTTTSQALTKGTAQKMREHGFDLVKIEGHKVGEPPGGHDECSDHIGQTVSLADDPELPPFFPNCRCFILPAVEAFDVPPLETVTA